MGEKIASQAAAPRPNTLTDEEKAAGWKLLFNGENLDGWRNFKSSGIRPGWQVRDGALVCADPRNAGDLCTDEKFDWFELTLEYDISQHSGSQQPFRRQGRHSGRAEADSSSRLQGGRRPRAAVVRPVSASADPSTGSASCAKRQGGGSHPAS